MEEREKEEKTCLSDKAATEGLDILVKDFVILKSSSAFIMKAGFLKRSAQFLVRKGKESHFLS